MNSSQNDNKDKSKKDNIVPFKARTKKRPKKEIKKINENVSTSVSEPLINIPTVTKYLAGALILIHIILHVLIDEKLLNEAIINLSFVSGRFTGTAIFEPLALITPLTHILIHGSMLHIGMNVVMLVAFGSGIEKWIGGQKFLIVFFGSALLGLALHIAFNYYTVTPVIGASGGISGLFAVALLMLNRARANMFGSGKYGMLPVIALWIGISLLFGLTGSPDGAGVSWEAHIGGFLGGFLIAKILKL